MQKLSMTELNRITVDEFRQANKIPLVIVLDNIRSQHNTGSVFRTSDAFRVSKIYLCGITATPPNREIQKSALGATESVAWEYRESTLETIEALKAEGFTIVAAEQATSSISPHQLEITEGSKYALVLGNEVQGVDDEVMNHCELCIEIPQYGTKHSLNVSVSAGILIWDFFNKFNTMHSRN
ncbi:MAG: RNA methyltransferase [Lentimicrobium sp.]|jgi:tRNA G18 (ribose-2'-O)-methylase SpoU|nr:RNA methyltransferase [Lentimicrobium sp.]